VVAVAGKDVLEICKKGRRKQEYLVVSDIRDTTARLKFPTRRKTNRIDPKN